MTWNEFRCKWLNLVSTVASLLGLYVLFNYDLLEPIVDGKKFLLQLLDWRTFLGATIFVVLLILGLFPLVYWASRAYLQFSAQPVLLISLQFWQRRIRSHVERAISSSRPSRLRRESRTIWNRLAAAAIEGTADEAVIQSWADGDAGDQSLPLIYCNFQGYAHAVTKVTESIRKIKCHGSYPQIWTVLKRPIWQWYNPFPISLADSNEAYFSLTWWESYKSRMIDLKRGSDIRVFRLAAHREENHRRQDISEYGLYFETPLSVKEARKHAKGMRDVEWHFSVSHVLESAQELPSEARIYMIGKSRSGDEPPCGKLAAHFASTYHSHGHPDLTRSGVWLSYLKKYSQLGRVMSFSDVFVVVLSETASFGVVYVDDDVRDVNGLRFLPQHELTTLPLPGGIPPLRKCLEDAWQDERSQLEYVVCQE